jgi:hypothetical protein
MYVSVYRIMITLEPERRPQIEAYHVTMSRGSSRDLRRDYLCRRQKAVA